MDKIGSATGNILVRAQNPIALSPSTLPVVRPALTDREADSLIPGRVWSNFIPEREARTVVRALAPAERAAVLRREASLRDGLMKFQHGERDRARAALHAMLGGFRSLRERGDNAETAVEVLLAVLRDFPAWAIEEACLRVAQRRTGLEPPLDPRWPPNDAQVHAVAAAVVDPYRKSLKAAQALLAAPVEPPAPPPAARVVQQDWHVLAWRRHSIEQDGRHAERVAADLAKRAEQRTQVSA